jgi:imidazolonepropionase-like amidohydrolase
MSKTKTIVAVFYAVVAAASHTICVADDSQKPVRPSLYIDNIHIVDVITGNIIKHRQVHISDGKIVAIQAAQTPVTDKQAARYDGAGRYLSPGLIDMHVHAYEPAAFVITLSHGVTHVRVMNGVLEQIKWRNELENGSRLGSTLSLSSPIISGFKNASMHTSATTEAEAIKAVQNAKQQGYDLIKAYGNLSAPVLRALLNEAKKQALPVAKHGPHPAQDMPWAEFTGLQTLEHVEDIYQGPLKYQEDQAALDDTIAQLKILNTPITPTLNIFWQLTQISDQKQTYLDSLPQDYISPIIALEEKHGQVKRWLNASSGMVQHNQKTFAYLQEITRQLHRAELTLLVGSDSGVLLSPHGLATHREMELMQQAGLPTIAILRAATTNAAQALGMASQLGQVAVGYNADLLLSRQNPLAQLSTLKEPDAVIKQGRLFSQQELKQLRTEAINARSFWEEMNILRRAW